MAGTCQELLFFIFASCEPLMSLKLMTHYVKALNSLYTASQNFPPFSKNPKFKLPLPLGSKYEKKNHPNTIQVVLVLAW